MHAGVKKQRPLRQRYIVSFVTAVLAVTLAGCAVGPDFVRPPAPQVTRYTADEVPAAMSPGEGEPAQLLATGQALSAQWWDLYHSPRLNQVLEQAIAQSPTLAAAKATLAQAQQAVIQAQGGYYPRVGVSANAQRQSTEVRGAVASTSNLYSLGPNVSYVLDVFGGTRRRVEQQQALADNQRYQVAVAYLTLTGNAVSQAINIASTRLQISTVQDIIADDEQNLKLVRLKFDAGKAANLDVLTAESQLASDRTLLPPLQQQLSAASHALTVLVGKFPGEWTAPEFDLTEFTLPEELPLSIPSDLVRQRPDILAAEAQLHASSAAIGVAASQLYPNLTLTGSLGVESLSSANVFQWSSRFWNLVAGLTAPLFQGGSLKAQKQAAIDGFEASAGIYRQTVLTAFGQVADVLNALAFDAELVSAQKNALDTSSNSLKLQRLSYESGKSDLLQLLNAQRAYQQAQLGYARAKAQRHQDTAQFFVAMGGGWWDAQGLIAPNITQGISMDKSNLERD